MFNRGGNNLPTEGLSLPEDVESIAKFVLDCTNKGFNF